MVSRAGYGRTSNQGKRENSERWLLTYADLITLLLAFFVLMYAMSSADAQKFSKLAGSMRKAFNTGVLEGGDDISILEQSMDPSAVTGGLEDDAASGQARDLELIIGEMGWISQQEGLVDKVTFSVRPEGIAISISGNLLFSSGRAELRPDSVQLLQSLSRVLAQLPNQVKVEGHTDDVPPGGTEFPSNWELSGARAVTVARYLAEAGGIDPTRLSAVAYSEFRPVAPNDSPRMRARNRRSEILIQYPGPSASTGPAFSLNWARPAPISRREMNDDVTDR